MGTVAAVTPSPVQAVLTPPALPRLGVIALATDLTSERDVARLVPPDRAFVHTARIAFENPSTPENLARMAPRLTETAALLVPGVHLTAIFYSCTAASVAIGEAAVAAAIEAARPGVPAVTPSGAAVAAFAALGVRRIALVTPYLAETTQPMAQYFAGQGLDVVTAHGLGLADDRDIARIDPASIVAAAEAADTPEAEGLFLSCTALRAAEVVDAIEARLGKPVVTSNQAAIWRMTRHAGLALPGPGRLFSLAPGALAA
jgi:maleate isomerase